MRSTGNRGDGHDRPTESNLESHRPTTIANINTTGFKRARAEFNRPSLSDRQASKRGRPLTRATRRSSPEGVEVRPGRQARRHPATFMPKGALTATGNCAGSRR